MKKVSDFGEDKLISFITEKAPTHSDVLCGIGDDCAVLKSESPDTYTLLKTDSIIENVHFSRNADPTLIGWKAAARVVSDFAAMGGIPKALMIAIAIPGNLEVDYIHSIYQGIYRCAEKYNFSIVGGETSSNDKIFITVSGTGLAVESFLSRSGAKLRDKIWVTGKLGDSIKGKHLRFTPRTKEALWLKEHFQPTSMMDLSDGIAKDLPRLCKASKTHFKLELGNIPLNEGCTLQQGLSDGEDYELLFTSPLSTDTKFLKLWHDVFPDLALTCIGETTNSTKQHLRGGWEYFKSS